MRRRLSFYLLLCLGLNAPAPAADFITARDGKLYEGTNEFRFISFNVPNLLVIEDQVPFAEPNPWRLPDEFEINDALMTVRALGGTVARTYVITVRRTNDTAAMPRHVVAPGQFDEAAFRSLDVVLAAADRIGVRLIIPLVDQWPWMGGRAEYARWRGRPPDDFWTDARLRADFKATIRFVLTRTNTITGRKYADEPAVLCWETGNEVNSPPEWTRDIARFIKSLAPRQLVMDGFNTAVLRDESLTDPAVDIVTTHHYPGGKESFAAAITANAWRARGKKPYVVGEFGFVPTADMCAALAAIRTSGASGGLLWSLRFRNRDGGFYWHSEPYGGNLYKAFHWPASRLGEPYDEAVLLHAVRTNAFAIRGLTSPPVPVPVPPKLLPITNVAAISWQGSVGAVSYAVERAPSPDGPWQMVAPAVDEAFTQYRPQFSDESAAAGRWFYRVRAQNESGISPPSNVAAVLVMTVTMVDEFAGFQKVHTRTGDWQIVNRDCRSAREDAHRAAGGAGAELTYALQAGAGRFRLFAFCPTAVGDASFQTSADGVIWHDLAGDRETFFDGAGEYGYWPALQFTGEIPASARFFKLRVTGPLQLSRLELVRPAPAP